MHRAPTFSARHVRAWPEERVVPRAEILASGGHGTTGSKRKEGSASRFTVFQRTSLRFSGWSAGLDWLCSERTAAVRSSVVRCHRTGSWCCCHRLRLLCGLPQSRRRECKSSSFSQAHHISAHLNIIIPSLRGYCCYPPFAVDKTEVQRDELSQGHPAGKQRSLLNSE